MDKADSNDVDTWGEELEGERQAKEVAFSLYPLSHLLSLYINVLSNKMKWTYW